VPWHVARLVTRLVVDYFTYVARPVALARRAAFRVTHRQLLRLAQGRRRLLRLRRTAGCLGTSRGSSHGSSPTTSPHAGSSSTASPTPRVRVPRHVARLVTRLVVDYFDYVACPGALACRAAHHPARRRLLHLRRAFGCFGTSRGLSRDSSSTTSPHAGSSSTTSPTPCVRVPRHVARLVTRLVADYLASRRLVVDYFAYAVRPGASARRAARHAARRRLLRLRRASGCLGMSHGSSPGSSSTTSPTPRVRVPRHVAWLVTRLVIDYLTSRRLVGDYFAYAARPGASAHRVAHHSTRRRLPRLAQACRRLLRLRHASGCLGTSRSSSRYSSRRSSSSTLPTPRVRVPWYVAWLISPLVVDYFASAARRRQLRLRRASGCLGTSRSSSRGSSSTTPCAKTSSCDHTGSTSATSCVATTCLAATLALLRLRRALP
jgi:hypothetical protein